MDCVLIKQLKRLAGKEKKKSYRTVMMYDTGSLLTYIAHQPHFSFSILGRT